MICTLTDCMSHEREAEEKEEYRRTPFHGKAQPDA